MTDENQIIRDYLSACGRKGGLAGKGKRKQCAPGQRRAAMLKIWAKRKSAQKRKRLY